MSRVFKAIFTSDNGLHVLLGFAVLVLTHLWLPLAAVAALYLREQGQARSWTLNLSFHKHMEWVVPSVIICGLYLLFTMGL